MSNKFSNTATTFNSSSLHKQEELIREIAQQQFFLLFQDIKIEIETKIKSIDRNIIELRQQVRKIGSQNKEKDLSEVLEKLQKIEAEMQLLRYQQQFELRTSRSRSLDKDRKPIFRKDSKEQQDFSTILGEEDNRQTKSQKRILEAKELNSKPPLPPDPSKLTLPIESKNEFSLSLQSSKPRKNLALEDSGASIHRWLQQNNNRQETCFNQIIREEDIEESVFY